ncbi:MAG: preprotein translocase subunit SecG [Lentisphaeria bacterium]|nr:preprotein translocase subunit SecG [Lentisphaeria bacterium]
MAITTVFLYVMIFVVSLLLIALILIQPSKSGGMGAAFGGIGESVFGGKAGSHLTKTTVIMTTIFFIIALALAAFIGHGMNSGGDGVREELDKQAAQEALPAAKAAAAPEAGAAPAPVPAVPPAQK